MIVTPGQNGARRAVEQDLQSASDEPKLSLIKDAVISVQDVARQYYNRNQVAQDWWRARWGGQSEDGRRWASPEDDYEVWPWAGASDTRVRLCEKLVKEHCTVGRYALMNAKVQTKSNRPLVSARDSQIATTLLNWMIYTHCWQEENREKDLMLANRFGLGCSVTSVEWDSQQRLEYIPVSMMSLGAFVTKAGQSLMSQQQKAYQTQSASQMSDKQLALGFMQALAQTRSPLLELQDMIKDPAYDADLSRVIQAMSPVVTKQKAKSILNDLRQLRTAEIPVPYVFRSRPRRTTLRPMIDVLFPETTDDLQRAAFVDQVEYVSGTEIQDRIETHGYDAEFVDQVLDRRGPSQTGGAMERIAQYRDNGYTVIGPGGRNGSGRDVKNDWTEDIELHHFHMLVQDHGVPVIFTTVLHMDLDIVAKHEPCEYQHGEMIFHGHRFETEDRPLLSSRGIPEIAYSWEQEIKKQRDGRTDRIDLVLRPPIWTTAYDEVSKYKSQLGIPGMIVPMRRFDQIEKDKPPIWDPGSIEIEKTINAAANAHFWGDPENTVMVQLRPQELSDALHSEEKPIVNQQWQLTQQYLPPATVARVVGPLQRPFEVDREDIQGQFEITITSDTRELDKDWMKEKGAMLASLRPLDSGGVIDWNTVVKNLFSGIDYDLADTAVKDQGEATDKEVQDEMQAFSLIIGSGRPQPLPKAGNFQLRQQVLQQEFQTAMQTDSDFAKRIQDFPNTMKVLQTRLAYYSRQLQQTQNAAIGRSQVADPFTGKAPQLQDATTQ